jgi:hypothetical protein
MMISAAAATPELALAIGIPVTIISFVFAGFYSKSSNRVVELLRGGRSGLRYCQTLVME